MVFNELVKEINPELDNWLSYAITLYFV